MLLSNLNLLATAPGGVVRLRELILTLAVQGKLVAQDPKDEPARALLKKIRTEKDRLIAAGKIKRDKPLAPIAEGEQPFALSAGWKWVRLRDLVTHLGDGLHGTPTYSPDGEYFFVNGNNLGAGVITIKPETKRVDQSEFENEVGTHFQAGKLTSMETVVDGLDQAVDAFIGLFGGNNVGKMVVKLS